MDSKQRMHVYSSRELANRPLVEGYTIDDPSTQDMDDGLWVDRRENGWRILISIADVSRAVFRDTDIDLKARAQGFTLYHPLGNRPMLPDDMDRDRLSLVEGVLRPAVTVEGVLDDQFNVIETSIYRSAFLSRKKLSYETFLELSGDPSHRFFLWAQLAQGLLQQRRRAGSLSLEDLNKGLRVDGEGHLCGSGVESHRGHMFVGEASIFANRVVGKHMRDHNVPALYRNHAADAVEPDMGPRLLYNVRDAILSESDSDYKAAIKRLRLWFLRARYETDVKGHFGLAVQEYLHFTSPIRRYADLAVHRNLLAHIEGRPIVHGVDELNTIGAHLNARNDEERDFHQSEMYKEVLYQRMSRRVRSTGAVFDNLHNEELRMALFAAHYEGIESRHLLSEVKRRAAHGTLGDVVAHYILNDVDSDNGYWHDMRRACRPEGRKLSIIHNFAQSVAHWAPPAKLLPRNAGPGFGAFAPA